MHIATAEIIARKTRGAKHCEKLLKSIDKKGDIDIPLGNTGVELPVSKGDPIHTLLKSIHFKLLHEINVIEVAKGVTENRGRFPAPVGAADAVMSTCPCCGKVFYKNSNRQKYCSAECRCNKNRK